MTVINDQKGEVTSSLCTVYDSQRKETTPPPSPAQDAPEAPSARSQALGLAMLDRGLRKLRRRNTCPEAPSRNEEKSELAKKTKVTRKIKSPLTTHDKENDSCFFFFFFLKTRPERRKSSDSAQLFPPSARSFLSWRSLAPASARGGVVGPGAPAFPPLLVSIWVSAALSKFLSTSSQCVKLTLLRPAGPNLVWEARPGRASPAAGGALGCPGVPAADWPPTSVENILLPRFFVGKSAGRCWLDHTQSEANGTRLNRLRARVSEARDFQREPHVFSDTL